MAHGEGLGPNHTVLDSLLLMNHQYQVKAKHLRFNCEHYFITVHLDYKLGQFKASETPLTWVERVERRSRSPHLGAF